MTTRRCTPSRPAPAARAGGGACSPAELGVRPTKQRGQNFVIDANTVRRIVRDSPASAADDVVVEVGPGPGVADPGAAARSAAVVAVEIDPVLAAALPATIADARPGQRRPVRGGRAPTRCGSPRCPARRRPRWSPTCPTTSRCRSLLHLLERCPRCERGLVMVQAEVADRLAAGARLARSTACRRQGRLVRRRTPRRRGRPQRLLAGAQRRLRPGRLDAPRAAGDHRDAARRSSRCVDAAFAQRRKTLRAALAGWPARADRPPRRRCARPASTRWTRGE